MALRKVIHAETVSTPIGCFGDIPERWPKQADLRDAVDERPWRRKVAAKPAGFSGADYG